MLIRLFRCLAAVLLVFSLSLPFAAAQNDPKQDDTKLKRGVQLDPNGEEDKSGPAAPVFPYFVLILYSMLVLTIVFMPSRKA